MFNGPGIADLSLSSWHIPRDWGSTDLPLLVVPLTLLQLHVDLTSSTLAELIRRVESVESKVLASASGVADFDTLIRALHACNTDLIKLERRWNFEMKLAASFLAVISQYRQPSTNFQELNFGGCTFHGPVNFESGGSGGPSAEQRHDSTIGTTKSFKMLESFAVLQERRSRAIEYDLGVLPRRIANQFTAVGGIPRRPLRSLAACRYILLTGLCLQVYNLVAQRDAKATLELTIDSGEVAKAALRDSSSMKTIAVMTLIFLPATFACVRVA